MFIAYVHGFNSGPESRSGRAIAQLLGRPIYCARNDYSLPFAECLANLQAQIAACAGPDEPVCAIGTSLGGFYALHLRMPNISRIVAFNPVIFPALQLAQFVGENIRFTDGQKWIFSRDSQLSYAAAPDARIWANSAGRRDGASAACPDRFVFLGDHDELLDHMIGKIFWQDHAATAVVDSGHNIEDFTPFGKYLQP